MTPKVTREEIEKLCILHAVGVGGCTLCDLPERLGLSPTLTHAVAESLGPLLTLGWLVNDGGAVTRTEAGQRWLTRRLSELGVS